MEVGMSNPYRDDNPKHPINLSLNAGLLKQGKDLGINVSRVAEEALAHAVSAKLAERWQAETRDAIEAYNRRVETQGVFSDGLRAF
jgi:antitoxin CcdA